jgi:hypothetical protein
MYSLLVVPNLVEHSDRKPGKLLNSCVDITETQVVQEDL